MIKRLVLWFEHIGRMRAASELARQGYHQQAKRLMCDRRLPKFVRILAVFLTTTILISDDVVGTSSTKKVNEKRSKLCGPYTDEELDFINGN